MSNLYKVIPERERVIEFNGSLGLSQEEEAVLKALPISYVLVDDAKALWQIFYSAQEEAASVNKLPAVAEKLAAACSLRKIEFKAENDTKKIVHDYELTSVAEEPFSEDCDISKISTDEEFVSEEYLKALKVVNDTENSPDKEGVVFGRKFTKASVGMHQLSEEENNVVVEGKVVGYKVRETRTGVVVLSIYVADENDGITVKMRFGDGKNKEDLSKNLQEAEKFQGKLPIGAYARIQGDARLDNYENNEIVLQHIKGIIKLIPEERFDNAKIKRVELHCHTKMSKMDAITPIKGLVKQAIKWGHKALAITDHGVVQAFPFAYDEAKGKDLKLIFGVEAYLWPDENSTETFHIILLAKNPEGLRNLYRLISLSHLRYFGGKRARPRMTRALINQYRQGILVGSACAAGELFKAMLDNKSESELLEIAKFYDYLEIQPLGNNKFLIKDEKQPNITSDEDLAVFNKRIYTLGKKLQKLTVATCDVHFLNPENAIARTILQTAMGYKDAQDQPPLYLRTTEEMLKEFAYLGEEAAYEVTVTNTNLINEQIESFKPVPDRDQLYVPVIPGAEKKLTDMTYHRAKELYGDPLPKLVADRLELELKSIIGNGYSVLYYIAQQLVKKSNDDGFVVGSRGSVGSSFVATMMNITEVNPLQPHYLCPKCKHVEFFEDGSVGSGFDLPEKHCPECGTFMGRNGHNIPFAVFLGFKGDKVPDIDLNFSPLYQATAQKYTEELFGRDNVFKAGTISTLADRNAYGYVKKYFEGKGERVRTAYVESLIPQLTGVKKTTGTHPGGVVVVPRNLDIHYITPINYSADKLDEMVITTHFDFHSFDERVVKLDILAHDDPTMIRMLESLLHINTKEIPIADKDTMELFLSTKSLGVTPEEIGSEVGTLGVPECGTQFVRQMIADVKPKNFSDLLRISGYSHGTDVWLNNAQDLLKNGIPTEETISMRDDIMTSLISKGVEPSMAFEIMEYCRKGKAKKSGLQPKQLEALHAAGIPEWYIQSCQTLTYLFPKAHAVAYVIMAYRIAYCKVHYPKEFYAAFFSIRTPKFDFSEVAKGNRYLKECIKKFYAKGNAATTDEKKTLAYMESVVEMQARGIDFEPIDLYRSDATKFLVTDKGLLPPFGAVAGIGANAAEALAAARQGGVFLSQEDVRKRSKVSSDVMNSLQALGVFDDLPESSQISLF